MNGKHGVTQGVAFMNKTVARSVAMGTATIVAIIVGYLGIRTQHGPVHEFSSPPQGHYTDREREEAVRSCLKMQADGCYME
jgi:hypothetical protein